MNQTLLIMTEEVLNFKILGEPKPKQSFRATIRAGQIHAYQPESVEGATDDILTQVIAQLPQGHIPWGGGIKAQMQFIFPFTQALRKNKAIMESYKAGNKILKTTKPDLDNLEKLVYDAMAYRVYVNDSQICNKFSEKIYGDIPGIKISLKHIGS